DQPLVFIVDGLQHFDEISVSLAVDLSRHLLQHPLEDLRWIIAYREEGPHRVLLRELSEEISRDHLDCVLSLRGLDVEPAYQIYSDLLAAEPDSARPREDSALRLFEQTRGLPARIVAFAGSKSTVARDGSDGDSPPLDPESDLDRIRLCAALIERPFSESEIKRWLEIRSKPLRECLSTLERRSLLRRAESEGTWVSRTPLDELVFEKSSARTLHAAIAKDLSRRKSSTSGPGSVEVFRHFRAAGLQGESLDYGKHAVEHLSQTFQSRAALRVIDSIMGIVETRETSLRNDMVLKAADLCARLGETTRGLELVRGELSRAPRSRPQAKLRLQLRLASLYVRRGEFGRADPVFSEVFSQIDQAENGKRLPIPIELDEYLYFLNEHAALKNFLGQHETALDLCKRGLDRSARRRSFAIREAALNFHATRANVYLRTFEPTSAVASYEKALSIAESIGSEVNRAVILNNLGIVRMQEERSDEAIRLLSDAEALCLRLDDGPSLVSIYCNLALLQARTGQAKRCDESLESARSLRPKDIGERHSFFLSHATGVSLLYRGRFDDAAKAFDEALESSASREDPHVSDYDRVFRAECLIHTARYREADESLSAVADRVAVDSNFARMVYARRRLLHALSGGAIGAPQDSAQLTDPRSVLPLLQTLDVLLVEWADSIEGLADESFAARLLLLERRLEERQYLPLLSLCRWIRAERHLLREEYGAGKTVLSELEPSSSDLVRALAPLLNARLELATDTPRSLRRAADALSNADVALASNRLPEWSLRARRLREQITPSPKREESAVLSDRNQLSRPLDSKKRNAYLQSEHWLSWTSVTTTRVSDPGSTEGVAGDNESDRTEPLDGRPHSTSVDPAQSFGLVTRSKTMRELSNTLTKLCASELPVLIHGEPGTGKELVARYLHAQSPRATGPFRVVNCAGLSHGVANVELFGARAGSFTDAASDQTGLLRSADGGTVLFDDISELAVEVQARLLRVIDTATNRPVGSHREESLDVRFLFSSALSADQLAESDQVRSDLFHRIHVASVTVPPLAERREDFQELVASILREECGTAGRPVSIDDDALQFLRKRSWPGNVRELRNFILRLLVSSPERVTLRDVHAASDDAATQSWFPQGVLATHDIDELRERLEREFIVFHFRRLGNVEALESFLGISRRQLYRRCERLGISLRAERKKW
ncbi:MAG: sigma 54-interacting transcriptional regulator, partial [Planctomycetota bacterium]